MKIYHLISLCILVSAFTAVICLVEDHAQEQPCFQINNTVPVDVNWFSSLKRLYYPLMSKLDIYRLVRDMSGKPYEDLTDPEVYYDSCMYFEMDTKNNILKGHGFDGKKIQYKFKSFDPNLEKLEYRSMKQKSDDNVDTVTCYSTKTDNKTYAANACCTSDNQMMWTVSSAGKFLEKETIKEIQEHMTSLGFKKEYFTEFKYEACPDYERI